MQKMLQDQAQLLKEIEDRHALSAEFSKGKSINPFLQKRAVSGINESGMSGSNAISLDSSEADMNRVWEKGSAPFPTSLNAHVNHSNSFCLETGAFEIATPFKLKGRLSKKVDGIPILENVWKLKLVNSTEYIQEDSFEVGRDLIPANCREAWRVSCLDTSRGGLPTVLQVAETQLESFLEQIHSTTKLSQSPPLKKLWEDVVSWKPFRMEADSLVSWSDKFRPTSVEDILGAHNSSNAKAVKDWLLGWKGLGGGNTSDLKQVSTDPPAVLKQIPKLQNFKRVFDSDFIVDDEADGDYLEEIDDCSMQARSTSVSDDDDVFQSSHGEGRKRRRREKKAWKKSRVEDQLKSQHLRLIGPSSSGRSCCVKAIADECGFDVLEIHAGQKRSGKEVQSLLAEATQSHAVGDTATMAAAAVASTAVTESAASNVKSAFASLFAQKAEKASSLIGIDKEALGSKKKRRFVLDDDGSDEGAEIDVITVNRMACANAPQSRPTLILIEDADIVFDQDKGFWVAIWSILEVSKRPIVFICNDDPFSHQNLTVPSNLLSNLLNATIALQFQAPSFSDLFCYLHLIVLNEGYWINPEDIAALCHDSGYNMRKCLNAAELLCRTGGQQLSTSLATLSTLQVPTGRMREFNVRHARGSSDQALPVLDWASIALQPLPDPKLTVLQELDLIADVAENISMFNRLGKLRNFEFLEGNRHRYVLWYRHFTRRCFELIPCTHE
ncbi:hypothetical protein BC830DRAFT_474817 [Chytriomyces sp. MP71]|nr:hypothetical protein BC830DRAFT_474817 [Chytriomyces sp. MP71]